MSWKKQDAFSVNNSITSKHDSNHHDSKKNTNDKELSIKRLETEVLQTDVIESSLLIVNNKDTMLTSNRINIHTPDNSIVIPGAGAIKINDACKIDTNNVHITGNLLLDKAFNTRVILQTVKRISLDDENNFFLETNNFDESNHFILDCTRENAKGMLIVPPYRECSYNWSSKNLEYLYIMNLYINAKKESLVDVDIILKEQDISIKMHSRNSSLSLMWLPEGRWVIQSIGYKTSIINDM